MDAIVLTDCQAEGGRTVFCSRGIAMSIHRAGGGPVSRDRGHDGLRLRNHQRARTELQALVENSRPRVELSLPHPPISR